ncbi:MAG: WecB/TagA/CpsF family glycosyltransferase [Bacteroidota bacterium]
MQKIPFLHTRISTGSFEDFVQRVLDLGRQKQSSYTCCVNVHMIVESRQDMALKAAVDGADLAAPDGMPLCKVLKMKDNIEQERVAGMDLVPELLRRAAQEGLKVFFYGDTDEVLDALSQKSQTEFADLQIAGRYSPPFRALSEQEDQEIVDMINDSDADILFVALGCPKQEKWMAAHKGKVHASMLGIGNAFRTYLGYEKRAPQWMQKFALEWLYRLAQNPRRLFKRYFVSNSIFLLLLLTNRRISAPRNATA